MCRKQGVLVGRVLVSGKTEMRRTHTHGHGRDLMVRERKKTHLFTCSDKQKS